MRGLRSEGLRQVEEGEEDATKGGFATGGVVPLGEGVDASASAACRESCGGNPERKWDVGVGIAEAGVRCAG